MGDFKDIITKSLESSGFLNCLRAELRGEIYSNIKNEGYFLEEAKSLSEDHLLAANIFKDFLEKSKADNTLKTYTKEAKLLETDKINDEKLKIFDLNTDKDPIIYEIINKFNAKHKK
jgi:hypothetical protein